MIAQHVLRAKYRGVVCFSCGNAGDAIVRSLGQSLPVLHIGPRGDLNSHPARWFSPEEIHQHWPDYFDATSGHLPAWMMAQLAENFAASLGQIEAGKEFDVPTGSGETIMCLRWAYPHVQFRAVYGGPEPGCQYDKRAPLNAMVAATGPVLHLGE